VKRGELEMDLDVVGIDAAFATRVRASLDAGGVWWLDPQVGSSLFSVLNFTRRRKIRRAARARKDRRGWR
jgi:hypothetical protein